jgi:2,3-diketo-5-methylthio-1-phosphopentane phosphatase
MTNTPRCAVFCDFDGTISRRDVGYNLFRHFSGGANAQFIPAWKSGSMSSREILTAEAALVTGTQEEILSFVMDFQIDPTFANFAKICEQEQIPLHILSDGLETYITPLLKREKLDHLPVTANRGVFTNTGMAVEFPHTNNSCTRCGSCKAERIREFRMRHGNDATVVFVGDGMSDLCATKEADILFAKKDLEVYCQRNDIAYLQFTDFSDVLNALMARGLVDNTKD